MRSSSCRARVESHHPDSKQGKSRMRLARTEHSVDSRLKSSHFPQLVFLKSEPSCIPDKTSILTIIDWDDTLNPSHWCLQSKVFRQRGGSVSETLHYADKSDKLSLKSLSEIAAQTIKLCMSRGHVVIVTNAEAGWVESSARVLLPDVFKLLVDVPVVSARSCFQGLHKDSPILWKQLAFKRLVSEWSKNLLGDYLHVISIGDSVHEREALFRVHKEYVSIVPKSIKFRDRPSLFQLIAQHRVLQGKLPILFNEKGSLDLCISKSNLVNFQNFV